MEFYGCSFSYAGISSSSLTFDSRNISLIFASVDTSEYIGLQSEIEIQTIFNGLTNSTLEVGEDSRDSVITFDAEVITEDAIPLTTAEMKGIQKWLFSRRSFAKLYTDETSGIYLNCRFTSPEKIIGNGGVVGYKFTVVTDSSMAWEDSNTQTIDASGESIIVDSDLCDYIYPTLLIHVGSDGGDIIIINSSDDSNRKTKFSDVSPNATISMDGSTNMITTGYYERFTEKNFVRLLDGENVFTLSGDISSIDFTFNNRKFL